jgi:REP element-mobilizing transposase RayT
MPRIPRCLLPPSRFHVGSRGTGGVFVFVDDVDRDAFVVLLHRAAKMFGIELLAYSVLGTHFHVVVEVTSPGQLGRMMHRVLGLYAQGFNRRHGRKGHLFEERFWSWVIRDEDHFGAAVG